MLIPGQNKLAEPEIVAVPRFETLLEQFKQAAIGYIAEGDPAMAARVAETLENEAEVLTKLLEAATVMLQAERRHKNEQIKQMLAWWAKGSNLDAKVADLGLERQTIDPGDPNAFPPVPPEMEGDDELRMRYFLAPHAPAAGSRMHYRYEAMTLSSRARVSVEAGDPGEVVVRHRFEPDGYPALVKDANARRQSAGRVAVTLLSRTGDGTPTAALLDAAKAHFERPDVVTLNDDIAIQPAEIIRYEVRAVAYIHPGADATKIRGDAMGLVQAYADQQHVLGGGVERTWLASKIHDAGGVRVEIETPAQPIECADHQAPYCDAIEVEVRLL